MSNNRKIENKYRRFCYLRLLAIIFLNLIRLNGYHIKKYHLNNAFRHSEANENSDYIGYSLNYIGWKWRCFEAKWFEEFVYLDFEDIKPRAPKGYHDLLVYIYKDYMIPPPVDKIELMHSNDVGLKSK